MSITQEDLLKEETYYNHSLTIDRTIWARGYPANGSNFLCDSRTGKQCCVGFFSSSLGYSDEEITGVLRLEDLYSSWPIRRLSHFDKSLLHKNFPNLLDSLVAFYKANDRPEITESERERIITEKFEKFGVLVTFED